MDSSHVAAVRPCHRRRGARVSSDFSLTRTAEPGTVRLTMRPVFGPPSKDGFDVAAVSLCHCRRGGGSVPISRWREWPSAALAIGMMKCSPASSSHSASAAAAPTCRLNFPGYDFVKGTQIFRPPRVRATSNAALRPMRAASSERKGGSGGSEGGDIVPTTMGQQPLAGQGDKCHPEARCARP